MRISDWPAAERPREKLLQQGAAALSDAELLAIFLRTGTPGLSAVDLARQLLNDFGDLPTLISADLSVFCQAKGLGMAKYAQLQASVEMSKRCLARQLSERELFSKAEQTKDYLRLMLAGEAREVFALMLLDSQHRLLSFEPLFYGTVDSAAVYPREVVKKVIATNAAALILAHNHPSGVAEPSQADRHITERIRQAVNLIDVRLLDHIVVGHGECVSFAERGWL